MHRLGWTRVAVATVLVATGAALPNMASSGADVPLVCDGLPATIVGTAGDDDIVGTSGADVIVALAGNDSIDSLAGGDIVCGGDGDDYLNGGIGDDVLLGEAGNDRLRGGKGADSVDGGAGDDSVKGDQEADDVTGGPGNDYVMGGIGDDDVDGADGFDICDPQSEPGDRGVNAYTACEVIVSATTNLTVGAVIHELPLLLYRFTGHLSIGSVPVPGRVVTFTAGGSPLCTAVTDARGNAACEASGPVQVLIDRLTSFGYDGTYAGEPAILSGSSAHGDIVSIGALKL